MKSVTFATSCWERDWRHILLKPTYLSLNQIAYNLYPFQEKMLVINNVSDLSLVQEAAAEKIERGILSKVVIARDVLSFFGLKRSDFDEWQYYNALAPLNAIYHCESEYLLYLTGDVYLKSPVNWIKRALAYMEKDPSIAVANLTWNDNYKEAKKESFRKTWNFYVAERGFSDQMFLIRVKDFKAPIYGEIHPESHHYPRGDVFEKRVFSFMLNRQLKRISFRRGSYTHENIRPLA
jgi:hypothetical protein